MSQPDVDTTAAADPGAPAQDPAPTSPAATPVTATAPSVDVEKVRKQAKAEAWAEFQARQDRERAKQLKAQAAAEKARQKLEQAGVRDQELTVDYMDVVQKARMWDETQSEAEQWREWYAYQSQVAQAYGLSADDPRLANATSADELKQRAAAAMADDAKAERERLLKEAAEEKRKAADAVVASGALDTVTAEGAAPVDGQNRLRAEYEERRKRAMGNVFEMTKLQREFRQKGLKGV